MFPSESSGFSSNQGSHFRRVMSPTLRVTSWAPESQFGQEVCGSQAQGVAIWAPDVAGASQDTLLNVRFLLRYVIFTRFLEQEYT